jgi:hypothetical protein
VYADNHGNFYPQIYYGTLGGGVSGGYSSDLEGFLTGTSVSGRRPLLRRMSQTLRIRSTIALENGALPRQTVSTIRFCVTWRSIGSRQLQMLKAQALPTQAASDLSIRRAIS